MELFEMSPHEEPYLNHSEDLWFEWFLDGILNADIEGAGGGTNITLFARFEYFGI